jgi:acetyl esterase/lipase
LVQRLPARGSGVPDTVVIEDLAIPAGGDRPDVRVRVYRPRDANAATPALLWIHGGGMIAGNHLMDERSNANFTATLGITVVSVQYRLAPEHPAPAPLDDCFTALTWMHVNASEQRIDPARIAIGGASAGGGLAAALVLRAHDEGVVAPVMQLLLYPMLDDRTVLRTDLDTSMVRGWTTGSNRFAWGAYLGQSPGAVDVSPYAAPARRNDLTGLPPAWIGVGTFDLFFAEDTDYATRLDHSSVDVQLDIIEGAFHGFDALFPKKDVSRAFWQSQAAALRQALSPES